MTIVTE